VSFLQCVWQFFLAIFIDAYNIVKRKVVDQVTEQSLWLDGLDVMWLAFVSARNRWPPTQKIFLRLERLPVEMVTFPLLVNVLGDEDKALHFICYYKGYSFLLRSGDEASRIIKAHEAYAAKIKAAKDSNAATVRVSPWRKISGATFMLGVRKQMRKQASKRWLRGISTDHESDASMPVSGESVVEMDAKWMRALENMEQRLLRRMDEPSSPTTPPVTTRRRRTAQPTTVCDAATTSVSASQLDSELALVDSEHVECVGAEPHSSVCSPSAVTRTLARVRSSSAVSKTQAQASADPPRVPPPASGNTDLCDDVRQLSDREVLEMVRETQAEQRRLLARQEQLLASLAERRTTCVEEPRLSGNTYSSFL
jgi:hypothetical protein